MPRCDNIGAKSDAVDWYRSLVAKEMGVIDSRQPVIVYFRWRC